MQFMEDLEPIPVGKEGLSDVKRRVRVREGCGFRGGWTVRVLLRGGLARCPARKCVYEMRRALTQTYFRRHN